MLHVSNDMEAVVSHKGQSHHAISDLTLVNQPSPVAQLVEHPPRKWKVPGSSPGWVNTFQSVALVDWWLEHPPQKWKVLGSSPSWVNTFQKCGIG